MLKSYEEELVYTRSEDNITLEGAVIRPSGVPPKPLPIVWVHGLTGKFYAPQAVRIGRILAESGYTFVTGNNRGHDFGTVMRASGGERLIAGGGWELFDECPLDVGAWVSFAVSLGFPRVVLAGHSLGALKVGYYQAERQDPRVAGLIAASAPVRAGRLRPDLLEMAERMVAEGRGQDLLPWGISPAGGGTVSAQTYLGRARANIDVYGHHTPDPAVSRIRCPLLAIMGTDEEWVGTAAELEVIQRNATGALRVDAVMIEGADHVYTGREAEVARTVHDWIGRALIG